MDRKLIDAHQWIVDQTQKKPAWLAEQAIIASTLTEIVYRVLTWKPNGWDGVILFCVMLIGGVFVLITKNEASFKRIADVSFIRILMAVISVMNILTMLLKPDAKYLLHMFSSFTLAMFYYFACCENPRPKKRKEKLVLRTT